MDWTDFDSGFSFGLHCEEQTGIDTGWNVKEG